MTGTSGTYNFNPSFGGLMLQAYHKCGIRPSSLTQEHFQTAAMDANLMLGRWSSMGVDLWQVDLQQVPLVQGTATYSVPANTIVMLDAYIVQNSGGAAINRIISPISRTEYASYPNPQQQGQPTVFWFDRLLSPSVTLWQVPDGNEAYLNYYRLRQSMDVGFTDAQQVEMPYYFSEAFVLGLASRLAVSWAPDRAQGLKLLADEAYEIAATQNVETASQYISPIISGYWRV